MTKAENGDLYFDLETKAMVVCYGKTAYGRSVVLGNRVVECSGLRFNEAEIRIYPVGIMDRLEKIENRCWLNGDSRFHWEEPRLGWEGTWAVTGGSFSPRWLTNAGGSQDGL